MSSLSNDLSSLEEVEWLNRLENCIQPRMPDGPLMDENGEEDPTLIAVFSAPVSARKIMGKNFWGLHEFEKSKGIPSLPNKEYLEQGLTCSVPWTMYTLRSPCPFYKGRRICETHILEIAEVCNQEEEGSLEKPRKLKWFLYLKRKPINEEEARALELPPEYDFQKVCASGNDSVSFIIIRKPEREDY